MKENCECLSSTTTSYANSSLFTQGLDIGFGDWCIRMNCELCGHDLTDNSHGIDQNDLYYVEDTLKHSGHCTYCLVCNPSLKAFIEKIRREKE